MPLSIGTRLGPYEVVGPLGAGGMGEVYRAHDTKLDRDVALKVLPDSFAADPDRLMRFEREAKAVAALSHPNILSIYDFGTHEGIAFAVMELLDGETLRSRLDEGRLPPRKAIEVALQIAGGLAAAHDKGIVHRDLKPDNVIVTRDGRVKILDFGLAKVQTAAHAAGASAGPTVTAGTAPGLVMGTAGYMAPEQVRGQAVDHRADLFALGAMLYELLAGARAFKGDSAVETMNAILKEDPPDLPTAGAAVPPVLDRIVRRCLEKNPDERFQSARDLAFALQAISGVVDSGSAAAIAQRGGRGANRTRTYILGGLIGAALAAAVAVALWLAWPAAQTEPRRVLRLTVDIPAGRTLGTFALSPDGSRLAYVGTEGGQSRLYVHPFDQSNDAVLADTDGATSPFFSPDSQWIAFFAGGRLKKIPARGGEVVTIADAGGVNAKHLTGTWASDDAIVFSAAHRALLRVPPSGGVPLSADAASSRDTGEYHWWPRLLPDRRSALVTVGAGGNNDPRRIDVVPIAGGPRRTLIADGARAQLLTTGHLVYAAGPLLVAARFDPTSSAGLGDPVTVVDSITYSGDRSTPLFDVSAIGDLAWAEGFEPSAVDVVRVDRHGREERLAAALPGTNSTLSLSPDGTRLAGYLTTWGQGFTTWMLDIPRGVLSRVALEGNPHAPVWLPDGRTLVYSSSHAGAANLFVQPADGSRAERLTTSAMHEDPGTWSRDGRWLAYAASSPKTKTDVWLLDYASRSSRPVRQGPEEEKHPAISPDGRWVAYASDESRRYEVYAEALSDGGGRVQLSGDGGNEPTWSASGREIFYRNGSQLMSVRVEPGQTLSAAPPALVFEGRFDPQGSMGPPGYAVSPDGQHFYFLRTTRAETTPQRIRVVVNWIEEFRRRVQK